MASQGDTSGDEVQWPQLSVNITKNIQRCHCINLTVRHCLSSVDSTSGRDWQADDGNCKIFIQSFVVEGLRRQTTKTFTSEITTLTKSSLFIIMNLSHLAQYSLFLLPFFSDLFYL